MTITDPQFSKPHTPVAGQRPIFFERFGDGTAYAINLDYPTGVQYLLRRAADRLDELLGQCSNPVVASRVEEVVDGDSKLDRHLLDKLIDPRGRIQKFRRREQVLATSQSPPKNQLSVWFHISNSCNLACNYCYIPELRKGVEVPVKGSVPDTELLTKIIKELFRVCRERGFSSLRLRFAGGEPVLAPDVIELACRAALAEASETGIDVSFAILTNGTLITPAILSLLKTYKFNGVSISVDGNPDLHDTYRFRIERREGKATRVGTWNTIFENVALLGAHGIRPYILTTITEKNFDKLDVLIDACIKHRLGFRLSPVRDMKTAGIPGLQDSILSTLRGIYATLPHRLPISRPIQNYANFAEWAPNVIKSVACGTCRSSFAVSQRGEISTCQMRLETSQGSVYEGFPEVFDKMQQNSANWRFVSSNQSTGGCSVCLWRSTCAGGCPEHTQMAYKTYDAPSPWCHLYGDFLPVYFKAIATQMKIHVDSRGGGAS